MFKLEVLGAEPPLEPPTPNRKPVECAECGAELNNAEEYFVFGDPPDIICAECCKAHVMDAIGGWFVPLADTLAELDHMPMFQKVTRRRRVSA